jgi:hypothetical protein
MEGSKIVSTYFADVGPFVYNGPTRCVADYIDPDTGMKYRLKQRHNTLNRILETKKALKLENNNFDLETKIRMKLSAFEREELTKANAALGEESFKSLRQTIKLGARQKLRDKLLSDQYEPITNDMKIADLSLIPHPFEPKENQHVFLVGMYDDILRDLIITQNEGEDVTSAILRGDIYPDNTVRGHLDNQQKVKLVNLKIR